MIKDVFIDEYGDSGLDISKGGTSEFFIITAIIVESSKVNVLRREIEEVRKKYFQTGEMKSKKINIRRRKIILSNIVKSQFKIFTFIVDKKNIYKNSGLSIKKSFYKYLNNRLYTELKQTQGDIFCLYDKHGGQEYIDSFRNYILKKNAGDLFADFYCEPIDSKNAVLIQLADIIGGTVAFGFEKKKNSDIYEDFKNMFSEHLYEPIVWPEKIYSRNDLAKYFSSSIKYDEDIAFVAIRSAKDFIDENAGKSDLQVKIQVEFLKILRFNFLNERNDEFISTGEISNNIEKKLNIIIVERRFRCAVGQLRDKGVLICSKSAGSNSGYKLPNSIADIEIFIKHETNILIPMIKRLDIMRNKILMATDNKFDILEPLKELQTERFLIKTSEYEGEILNNDKKTK